MRDLLARLVLILAVAGASVPPAPGFAQRYQPPSSRAGGIAARLLAAHNRERARVGVPALRWDPALAASAAAYAPTLAAIGRLQHSPRAGRPGHSENLWMGTSGAFSVEAMVGSWASERAWFRPGVFPYVSTTGNWFDVSHYTQMIWRSTTSLGCALHRTPRWDYLICRYAPKGNIDGRRVP